MPGAVSLGAYTLFG